MLGPIDPNEWPSSLEGLQNTFAAKLNVYRVMAHHPDLLVAWSSLRDHLVMKNQLGPALSEVVILRVGHRLGSEYERAHHIVRGRACGLTDARIRDILSGGQPADDVDRLLTRSVDELIDDKRLTQSTLEALTGKFGKTAALDLMALVGFYSTLAYLLETFRVPIDADIRDRLSAAPL